MTESSHHDLENPVPVIWLWDSMLVPLQGELSDAQAASLSNDILHGIRGRGCVALIIDASGLWLVDSHLCAVLADIAHSASLMGTRTILAGLRAEVALTLLTMDVMLAGVDTVLNLEQALESIGIGPSDQSDDVGTESGRARAQDSTDNDSVELQS